MTWPYRYIVLDLEPNGPLPQEIYRRRRMLAIGVSALVILIVAILVIVVVSNATGDSKPAENTSASGHTNHEGPEYTDEPEKRPRTA